MQTPSTSSFFSIPRRGVYVSDQSVPHHLTSLLSSLDVALKENNSERIKSIAGEFDELIKQKNKTIPGLLEQIFRGCNELLTNSHNATGNEEFCDLMFVITSTLLKGSLKEGKYDKCEAYVNALVKIAHLPYLIEPVLTVFHQLSTTDDLAFALLMEPIKSLEQQIAHRQPTYPEVEVPLQQPTVSQPEVKPLNWPLITNIVEAFIKGIKQGNATHALRNCQVLCGLHQALMSNNRGYEAAMLEAILESALKLIDELYFPATKSVTKPVSITKEFLDALLAVKKHIYAMQHISVDLEKKKIPVQPSTVPQVKVEMSKVQISTADIKLQFHQGREYVKAGDYVTAKKIYNDIREFLLMLTPGHPLTSLIWDQINFYVEKYALENNQAALDLMDFSGAR